MSAARNNWDGLLAPDEDILWLGQPHATVNWRGLISPLTLMGVFFTGFSMFWIGMAFVMTADTDAPFPFNFFPLFGLPFLATGLWMLGGRRLDAWLRKRKGFMLTNQTAVVAQNAPCKKTAESWPFGVHQTDAPQRIYSLMRHAGRDMREEKA